MKGLYSQSAQCGEISWRAGAVLGTSVLGTGGLELSAFLDVRSSNHSPVIITATMAQINEPFYVRYYSGHTGRFGHGSVARLLPSVSCLLTDAEFLEFDFRVVGDGRSASARYANNSNYRNDALIRKESMRSELSSGLKQHLLTSCSVRQLVDGIRNQENHQRQRNHERRRWPMAAEEQRREARA